jgi:hypothetical protein
LEEQLIASGKPQISTTDPDARALLVQDQVVEISYNMQAAVDDKYNLVVATHHQSQRSQRFIGYCN